MKFMKKKKTVVPNANVGAEKIVTEKKFNFKEALKNVLNVIKKGFGKFVNVVKKGCSALVNLCKTYKKTSAITAAVLLVAIVGLVLVPTFSKPSTEKEMTNKLEMLGKTFYEDFYFKSAGNGDEEKRKEFLTKYEQLGIKVSLENLIRYYVTTEKFKKEMVTTENDVEYIIDKDGNKKEFKDVNISERVELIEKVWFSSKKNTCDPDNTKVIIYPQDPIGDGNYKLELVTACGFKGEDTDTTTTKKNETNTTAQKAEETTKTTKKTKKK